MVGLTIAGEKASAIYQLSSMIYSTLLLLSLVIFVVLSALYLYKGFNFRQAVMQEWSNLVKMNFVPAISISLLLFAVAFMPIELRTFSEALANGYLRIPGGAAVITL